MKPSLRCVRSQEASLLKAATSGDAQRLTMLIEADTDVNALDKTKTSALMKAAESGWPDCIEVLLKADAKVNLKNNNKQCALLLACASGNLECVQKIVKAGAKVTAQIKAKLKPIISMSTRSHILRYLLEDEVFNMEEIIRILYYAIHRDAIKTVKAIALALGPTRLNRTRLLPISSDTALEKAVNMGRPKVVSCLIKAGADVNANQQHVFFQACTRGWPDTCKLMLSHCNEINHRVEDQTALDCAAQNGHVSVVRVLLESLKSATRPNPELENSEGNTALCIASLFGRTECVRALLQHGANLEHQNKAGDTPLFLAAQRACKDTVRLLVRAGANVNHQNLRKRTCAASMLYAHRLRRKFHGCSQSPIGTFNCLLRAGLDITLQDDEGRTVMETAVATRDLQDFDRNFGDTVAGILIYQGCYLGRALHLLILLRRRTYYRVAIREAILHPSLEPFDVDGYYPGVLQSSNIVAQMTPLRCAMVADNLLLVKFFVKNVFLHWQDVQSAPESPEKIGSHVREYVDELFSQPWSLLSLSFVKVSTCVGFGNLRESRLAATGLPDSLQRRLLFHQFKDETLDIDRL